MNKYYVDGSGWNGEESKACVVLRDQYNQFNKSVKICIYKFELTNNEAEYYALIEALKYAIRGDEIYTDSQLVVHQVSGQWKINFPHLRNLVNIVHKLQREGVKILWIPRNYNYAGKVLEGKI